LLWEGTCNNKERVGLNFHVSSGILELAHTCIRSLEFVVLVIHYLVSSGEYEFDALVRFVSKKG
jgi:hypothetical protein